MIFIIDFSDLRRKFARIGGSMKFILLLSCLLGFSRGVQAAAENGCIHCHKNQTQPQQLEHNYADWKKSTHAKHDVSCEACHRGNSNTQDPVKAHEGVLASRDEKSSVYFKNVPQTCGRCHTAELQEFQKSAHYKMLEKSGKGPNCLTCHGAMATTILTHDDLDKTCSLCHGKPTQAAKTLSLMDAVKNSLKLLQKQTGTDKTKLADFTQRYQVIQKKWHSFDVEYVTDLCQSLLKEMKQETKTP